MRLCIAAVPNAGSAPVASVSPGISFVCIAASLGRYCPRPVSFRSSKSCVFAGGFIHWGRNSRNGRTSGEFLPDLARRAPEICGKSASQHRQGCEIVRIYRASKLSTYSTMVVVLRSLAQAPARLVIEVRA